MVSTCNCDEMSEVADKRELRLARAKRDWTPAPFDTTPSNYRLSPGCWILGVVSCQDQFCLSECRQSLCSELLIHEYLSSKLGRDCKHAYS